jgi:hypothetical protein
MGVEFYSIGMILDIEAERLYAFGMNKRAFVIAACAMLLAREENA